MLVKYRKIDYVKYKIMVIFYKYKCQTCCKILQMK